MNSTAPTLRVNPWLIAISVMLATFMEVLDTSIANVALGHIAGSLSVSAEEATWVLTTYLIANAIVIPCSAWLSQVFGRKRLLMACLMIFTVSSFFCGLATSLPMLLLMRVIQGAGGGVLQPLAQSILLESFPKEKHGQAMGLYGLGVVLAPVVGPVLGGWITDNFSWRWIFYINIPVGLLALTMIGRFVQDPPWLKGAKATRLDGIGLAFMSLWLGCQEVLLDKGQEDDWFGSRFIQVMLVLAVIGFIVFIVRELNTDKPIVDLRILKNYNFSLGVILIAFTGVTLYGLTALLPLYLQSMMGYTAYQSGISMIPRGLGAVIGMPLAGKLVTKVPGRYLVATGFLAYAASAMQLAHITLDISAWTLFWPLLLNGLSVSLLFVPLQTLALGALPQVQVPNAAGIFNLLRNVGGSVGITLVTTLAARSAQRHQNVLVAHLTPYDPAFQSHLQNATTAFAAHGDKVLAQQQAVGSIYQTLVQQANFLAYLDNFRSFAAICFICMIAALFLKNVKAKAPMMAH